jgi:hypothetical protein
MPSDAATKHRRENFLLSRRFIPHNIYAWIFGRIPKSLVWKRPTPASEEINAVLFIKVMEFERVPVLHKT